MEQKTTLNWLCDISALIGPWTSLLPSMSSWLWSSLGLSTGPLNWSFFFLLLSFYCLYSPLLYQTSPNSCPLSPTRGKTNSCKVVLQSNWTLLFPTPHFAQVSTFAQLKRSSHGLSSIKPFTTERVSEAFLERGGGSSHPVFVNHILLLTTYLARWSHLSLTICQSSAMSKSYPLSSSSTHWCFLPPVDVFLT